MYKRIEYSEYRKKLINFPYENCFFNDNVIHMLSKFKLTSTNKIGDILYGNYEKPQLYDTYKMDKKYFFRILKYLNFFISGISVKKFKFKFNWVNSIKNSNRIYSLRYIDNYYGCTIQIAHDDYYYVRFYNRYDYSDKYYQCDQIDGLIKLIEMEYGNF